MWEKERKKWMKTQREHSEQRERERGGGEAGGVRAKKQMPHTESGLWTMAFQSTSLRSRGLSPIMI
jgi:hypothetical protein